ncbi:MAG TPA: carboxypeptidase regulatory-like domain-containing protein [Blastocatellia bacterium]|nr:carboxypeptidase regulatory-like domain-containing protein [Blastocatellia bacterium]
MRPHPLRTSSFPRIITISTLLFVAPILHAQSTADLQGRVVDPAHSVLSDVEIKVRNQATGLERVTQTDSEGNYLVAALPVGSYRIELSAPGFKKQIVESLLIEVGRSVVQDFELQVGDFSQEVIVTPGSQVLERTTTSVGHVVDQRLVQEAPLNGRYFLDLGLLVPGSVTPSQTGFSTTPSRGVGALAINTAGNREEAVNFMVNGITLNNMVFSSITFQPSIDTIKEFKVDNSTFSAEYGQNSGAVVNIATRSGSNDFHGELFEFFRNDVLDARNFFNFTSENPPPFKRNQFGGHFGGPIARNTAFFFFSYEGLHQRQGLDLNSLVLSNSERASATDPVIVKLIELIPRANFVDSSGTSRFVGSATAPVDVDQWTGDISYNLTGNDRLHGYYDIHRTEIVEPNRFGNTIPGFGHVFYDLRQIFTLSETHTFGPDLVNVARFGFNRQNGRNTPSAQLNPADFGIVAGREERIGLPQINIAGGSINFGGPSQFPAGRGDTTFVVGDTLSWLAGRHSLKLGGEFREILNNNFRLGTGTFNFPTVAAFLADTANSFSVTLGNQSSSIAQGALGFFVQDNYKWRPNLTFELGVRYDWNMTPTERYDRFVVFDPESGSLLRAGADFEDVYNQNNKNVQPRLGFAWDPWSSGRTSVRGAYAILTDQPMTSVVTALAANPPLAVPLTFSGPIRFDNALSLARGAGLAPQTVDQGFSNAYLQSWNLNVQRELTRDLTVMAGYFGSKGTHLIIRRNINQPVNGTRPYPALSASSSILPGVPLGNITQAEGAGNSSYNALWLSANQRLARGLQFNASYALSKSIDYNSLSSQGVVVQNSYDARGDRGVSDYDARHHFVISAIYELPFRGNTLVSGWQLAAIVQAQSGNPINIVTGNSTVNGVANTLRPDVNGTINIIGSVERWFDTSVFIPVARFGNLGRNVITGPGFNNTDFSVIKNTKVGEWMRVQFRAEFFDLFNHANFGQPGSVVGTPAFGRITNTRFPTGESGSSRQIQFALKLMF